MKRCSFRREMPGPIPAPSKSRVDWPCAGTGKRRCGTPPPKPRSVAAVATLVISALSACPVFADNEDWAESIKRFHPYALLDYTYDSNLLRISDKAADLIPGVSQDEESDRYLTIGAGFDTEFDVNRQRVLIDGRVYRRNYDRFDGLDHTGGDARVLWKWLYGDRWDGRIGYVYTRKLRDFANQTIPQKDMLDRHRLFATADRWFTPRWRAGVNASWADISSSERGGLDKNIARGGIAVDYVSTKGDSVGVEASYVDASYESAVARDYQEWYVGPTARWQVTAKTRFDANAGYIQREHEDLSERDFDGPVGQVAAVWEATERTQVSLSAWRELSTLDDEIADYAIVDAVELEPVWSFAAKTTLRALVRYENRDFQDNDEPLPGVPGREDDIRTYGLWLDWNFSNNGVFSIGYENEDRESTVELREYDFDSIQARLHIGI